MALSSNLSGQGLGKNTKGVALRDGKLFFSMLMLTRASGRTL